MVSGDYDRVLGVAEAITLVTQQCPNGHVRESAQAALDAIEKDGRDALLQQVFLVKTAMRGWQGDRAAQIHRSLQAFLDQQEAAAARPRPDGNSAKAD